MVISFCTSVINLLLSLKFISSIAIFFSIMSNAINITYFHTHGSSTIPGIAVHQHDGSQIHETNKIIKRYQIGISSLIEI